MLKAGIAVRDVLPKEHLLMLGYPEPKDRYDTGAHDTLYASAYVLENNGERVALISVDLCYISKVRAAEIRKLIETQTGIPANHISLSFTHTHSGPVTDSNPFEASDNMKELYPDYVDYVRDRIAEAVKDAADHLFDAQIGFGKGTCGKESGMGGNRHDPDGPQDPDVTVMAIRDLTGDLRGCLVHYAMHPTVLQADNNQLSADFPCYIREYLHNLHPNAVCAYLMGHSGNQSTRFFRKAQDFDECKRLGYLLATEAERVIAGMKFEGDPKLAVDVEGAYPPFKTLPTYDEAVKNAQKAKDEYDRLVAEGAPYATCRTAECTMIGTNSMMHTAYAYEHGGLENLRATQLPVEVQIIRIGDAAMVGFSCEAFVEIGLTIKSHSPFRYTFLNFLTNGAFISYFCTDEAFSEFSYEALGSQLAPGSAQALIDAADRAFQAVK